MLPDFPSLRAEIDKVLLASLRQRVDTGDPVLSQIRRFTQHEGREMQYEQVGGRIVQEGFNEIMAKFVVPIADVPDLVGDKLDRKLEEIAQDIISQAAKGFFRKVGESCSEAGTAIDAGGKPASAELFLEMVSSVQTDFDAEGNPTSSFVIHPDMAPTIKKISEQIENDPELKRRSEEILRRQREEWAARENNRKLVD